MPDSNEVERRIREMLLDMGEKQLLAKLESSLKAMDERHQRISEALEGMLQEVDGLLLRMDEKEEDALDDTRKTNWA
ncbi:MAG: hypothetical protein NTV25_03150 [Methanothrix sp.]|nr:hypothetical protein [Methanothrix sp.]